MKELLNPKTGQEDWFLWLWLAGWTAGGIWALTTILWQLAGKEMIDVSSGALKHRVEIAGIGISRNYATSEIRDLRVSVNSQANRWAQQQQPFPPLFGAGNGPVSFDYGARTIRIGSSLDEAEAKAVLEFLRPWLPPALFGEKAAW